MSRKMRKVQKQRGGNLAGPPEAPSCGEFRTMTGYQLSNRESGLYPAQLNSQVRMAGIPGLKTTHSDDFGFAPKQERVEQVRSKTPYPRKQTNIRNSAFWHHLTLIPLPRTKPSLLFPNQGCGTR
jgi:hypothetical protein